MEDIWFMKMALEEADAAYRVDEVPVGAVLVSEEGKVLSRDHNSKERKMDPAGHAEISAIRNASINLKSWRLNKCKLYVTLEPCIMCLAAIGQARISEVIFGAYDPKGGALSLGYHLHNDLRLNHRFNIKGGFLEFEGSKLMSQYFKEKRNYYK